MESTLFELIQKGGPLIWPIFLASIVALGIFLERILFFYRNTAPVDAFLNGIAQLLKNGKHQEALERCDDGYGPAIMIAQAAILKRHLPRAELKEVVQEVAQMQMPRLEAHLNVLATLAHVCPLLGLLGTVTGMIGAFLQIDRAGGTVQVADLSQHIWEALIATASGLTVAIVCYIAYNFLYSRVQAIVTDMERCGIEVIQILCDPLTQKSTSEASSTATSRQHL